MDRLTYLKGQKSTARKELKNYLIMFRDEISEESEIELPTKEGIKQMTSDEFDNWFISILSNLSMEDNNDLVFVELIENYICAVNNVDSAEATSNSIYY